MTFNASDYSVQEGQYSAVESAQAPVQRSAGPNVLAPIASAVGSAFELKASIDRKDRLEAKDLAQAQSTQFSNEYDAAIEKYSGAVSAGEMNRLQADTYLGQVKDELITRGASADDLNSTEISALKTLSGRALVEGSVEDREDKKAEELYLNGNYFNPYHTPEQKEAAMAQMFSDMSANAASTAEVNRLSLASKQAKEGSDAYVAAQRALKEEQIKALNKMLENSPTLLSNVKASIMAEYEADVADPQVGEAQARVNAQTSWMKFKQPAIRAAELTANKIEGGLPVQKKAYIDMLENSGGFLDNLGGATVLAEQEKILEEDKTRIKIALLNQGNAKLSTVVTEVFGGPQALTYFQGMIGETATEVNNFSIETLTREDGDPPPSFGGSEESLESARKLMSTSISDFLEGEYKGDPKNLDRLVSGHLAKLSADFKSLSQKEVNESLKEYATTEFGRYVKQRGLSGKDIDNVNRQLQDYKVDVAMSFNGVVQDLLNAEQEKARQKSVNPRGKITAAWVVGKEELDLTFSGGQVMFTGVNASAHKKASELNERLSGRFTRIVRTDSNLSGKSQEQVFNTWKEQLWPSEEPAQEEATPAVDFSQYEGQGGTDAAGNRFIIRNGLPVKVGGDSDGG